MSERKKTLNKHANGHSTFEMGITELLRAMENEGGGEMERAGERVDGGMGGRER